MSDFSRWPTKTGEIVDVHSRRAISYGRALSRRAGAPAHRLPPAGQGGICLFRGRIKALMPLPQDVDLRAVLTAFPRPNQAFWTLSVLWSGWLWGPEAALPLRNVLDRRRYDWNWHTSAIHNALSAVASNIPAGVPFFGLLPELVPGFLSAVLIAAEAAGFHLEGLALRAEVRGGYGVEVRVRESCRKRPRLEPRRAQPLREAVPCSLSGSAWCRALRGGGEFGQPHAAHLLGQFHHWAKRGARGRRRDQPRSCERA